MTGTMAEPGMDPCASLACVTIDPTGLWPIAAGLSAEAMQCPAA